MNRWPAKWGLNAAGSPLMFTPGESSMRNPPEPVRIESVPGLRDGSPGMHEATEPRPPRRGFFMPKTRRVADSVAPVPGGAKAGRQGG
jgi:hypothetical protein